jgi:hypothetical protein
MPKLKKKPTLTVPLDDMHWYTNTNAREETNKRVKSARHTFGHIKSTIKNIDEAFDDFFRHKRTSFDVHWGKMLMDEVFTFCNEIGRANGAALVRGEDPRLVVVKGFKESHALEMYLAQAKYLADTIHSVRLQVQTNEAELTASQRKLSASEVDEQVSRMLHDKLRDTYHEMDESWLALADKDRGAAASEASKLCDYSGLAHVQPIHYQYNTPEETLLFYLRRGLPEHQLMLKVIEYHKPDEAKLVKIIGNTVKHGYLAFISGRELIRAGNTIIANNRNEHSKSTDAQPSTPVQTRVTRRPCRRAAVA